MVIFKRKIEEADQFRSKLDSTTADDPNLSLDSTGSTGIYKDSDTQIAFTLNSTIFLQIQKGELILKESNNLTTGSQSNISIFVSGGALYYKGSSGTTTRLALA